FDYGRAQILKVVHKRHYFAAFDEFSSGCLIIHQCASNQLSPTPNSTSSGTSSESAVVMASRITSFTTSTSWLGHSKTNSSCTCNNIFDWKPRSANRCSILIMASLIKSAALP